jgi:hypothetical protein
MKIMKKIILLELITILILAACEKVVPVNVPKKEPRLVISAWLNKDKAIEVRVSKSLHILEASSLGPQGQQQFMITDAKPVVYENSISIDTLVYNQQEFIYKSPRNVKIRDGYTYSIKVTAPGYKEVTAQTNVPVQSAIAGLSRVKNARKNSDGEELDDVTIKLDDPPGTNYYLVRIFSATFNTMNPEFAISCVSSTDKDLEAVSEDGDPLGESCLDGNSLVMKDVNFNGRQKQLKISVESFLLQEQKYQNRPPSRPYVKVYQVTQDYFKYVKSLSAYQNSSDNPFAEPINVYSNVANGYGIFSANTVAVDTIR